MGVARDSIPLEILIADEEVDAARSVAAALLAAGHHAMTERDGAVALRRVEEHAVDLLICDVRLPGADGLTVLDRVKQLRPATSVILVSDCESVADAMESIRHGAAHYLVKPLCIDELLDSVREIALQIAASQRIQAVNARAANGPEAAIIGETSSIVALRELVRVLADADGPVLVTGETGTGKELVAQTLHRLGPRRDRPFVEVNCAAFPETLLEAELFGHEQGAFTGATHARDGRFRSADGGTMFLDEVGDISPGAQAKLLRVLESGTFQPLGSDRTHQVDVRIVSATNRDLRADAGPRFRDDLFYRLKMFHANAPPLRERMADLPLLVDHFLCGMCDDPPRLTPRAWAALAHYEYPGNVRELRHALAHAQVVSRGEEIDIQDLPAELRGAPGVGAAPDRDRIRSLAQAEREFERDYLLRTLRATGWNKTAAARLLGISRKTLWKKLRGLGIDAKPV